MSITKISPDVVDFDAGITISTTDNSTNLTLSSTDADANGGPILDFYRNSSSPADNDVLFQSNIYAENDADEKVAYGYINTFATDVSDGSESMKLNLNMYSGGSALNRLELSSSETVFNQDSGDIDFRVESDNDAHALFVQGSNGAVGIGVSDPGGLPLHLKVASGDNKLRMETAAKDAFVMEFENSTGDLKLGTNTNAGAFVVKDGGNVEITDGNLYFASGHGIDFGATSNAPGLAGLGTETLDDYEDGTWTPVLISGGSTNPTGGGALAPSGRYTKIGNRVWITFYVGRSWTNSPSGGIVISGLPYTINASTNGYYTPCVTYMVTYGNNGVPFLIPTSNDTTLSLYATSSGSTWPQLTWQDHAASSSGTYVTGTLSYHV
tara:strand:- start:40 stop:1182 length:1143 start_codon:yes stop_codon:yes gene_type:complete